MPEVAMIESVTPPHAEQDAARMVTLQQIVLPGPNGIGETALYLHDSGSVVVDVENREVVLLPDGRLWLDSYMNLFSLDLWARSCALGGLMLELRGQGRFHLRLWRLERAGGREQELIDRILTLTPEGVRLSPGPRLDLGPRAQGVLIIRLTALEEARFIGGAWLSPAPANPRDLRLALSITTFRREAAVDASVARMLRFLSGEGAALMKAAGCSAHLFVVDNGQSIALAPHPLLSIIPNNNLGGAGGFARGLAAARDGGFTHCLFMDDDASVEMESLVRTAAFLQLARDSRAAVAGAMISEARPWAMWENGAVFDRSCRPRHLGTDLRDGPAVIRMLTDAARPTPRGFYAGWWYFAFPLEHVRHYPFPFFVRGDDISFSLAHDFRIATINGVVSLQEDFSDKESPLTLYLDLRNHLHHHMVHEGMDIGANGTAKIVAHFLMRSIVRMHYESAEAQLQAWQDVMRGPEFFASNADMSRRRAEVAALARTEAWRPAESADFAMPEMPPQEPSARYGRLMKWLLNGHLVPFWRLWGRRVRIPATHRGLIWPLWGVREAVFLSPDETRAYRVSHSKRHGWSLIWRAFRLYLRWRRDYARLRDAHRRGYEELASRDFWDGLFLQTAPLSSTANRADVADEPSRHRSPPAPAAGASSAAP